jgi:hypothetical protein
VIAGGPIPPGINVRGFSHVLGECGISFLAVTHLARPLRKDFPRSLNGAPLLIPGENNLVQAKLIDWLDSLRVYPRIVGGIRRQRPDESIWSGRCRDFYHTDPHRHGSGEAIRRTHHRQHGGRA